MGSLSDRVRRWLESDTPYVECRNCGTELDPDAGTCPQCGSAEISHYDLD